MANEELKAHIVQRTQQSPRRRLADPAFRIGRRAGWYALIRALQPDHVVETGTDKGLGSVVIAAALLANGRGRLTTIDINAESGYLISGRYSEVISRILSDSVEALRAMNFGVDMFIHDSEHSPEYEYLEYTTVASKLNLGSVVLSDNSHATDELANWARSTQRDFWYFQEFPKNHWSRGAGIGAASHRPRDDIREATADDGL
jgi:hypothetical protein